MLRVADPRSGARFCEAQRVGNSCGLEIILAVTLEKPSFYHSCMMPFRLLPSPYHILFI